MYISVSVNNVKKFKEVLLYILTKSSVEEDVIYKLLYFIDFDFYEKYEEQFFGAFYKKNSCGPIPIQFEAIVNSMISTRELRKIKIFYSQKKEEKFLPLREPNLDCLSGKEIAVIDEVLGRFYDKSASQISEYSKGDIPYMVTDDGEIIDYETVFYRTPEYSVRDYENE